MGKIVSKTWSTSLTSTAPFTLTSEDFNGETPKIVVVTAIDTLGYGQTNSRAVASYTLWCDDSPWTIPVGFWTYQRYYQGIQGSVRGGFIQVLSGSFGKSWFISNGTGSNPISSGNVVPTANGVQVVPVDNTNSGNVQLIIQAYGGSGIVSTSFDLINPGAVGHIGRNRTHTVTCNNPSCTPNFTLTMGAHNNTSNQLGAGVSIGFAGLHQGTTLRNHCLGTYGSQVSYSDKPLARLSTTEIHAKPTGLFSYPARERFAVTSYAQGEVGLTTSENETWTRESVVYMVNAELRSPEQLAIFSENVATGSGAYSVGESTKVPVSAFILSKITNSGYSTVNAGGPDYGIGIFQTDGSDNGHSISIALEPAPVGIPTVHSLKTRGARKTGFMVCRAVDWNDPSNATWTYSVTTSFNANTYKLDVGARSGATNRGFGLVGFTFASGGPTMFLGDNEVSSLKLGTEEIDSVFLGSEEV